MLDCCWNKRQTSPQITRLEQHGWRRKATANGSGVNSLDRGLKRAANLNGFYKLILGGLNRTLNETVGLGVKRALRDMGKLLLAV
jgi:hypothetical protein